MENPIKMDELGGPPLFLVQHPYVHAGCCDQFGFQVWNTSFCTEFVAPKRIVPCFFFACWPGRLKTQRFGVEL